MTSRRLFLGAAAALAALPSTTAADAAAPGVTSDGPPAADSGVVTVVARDVDGSADVQAGPLAGEVAPEDAATLRVSYTPTAIHLDVSLEDSGTLVGTSAVLSPADAEALAALLADDRAGTLAAEGVGDLDAPGTVGLLDEREDGPAPTARVRVDPGSPFPGSSALWLSVATDGATYQTVSHLDREGRRVVASALEVAATEYRDWSATTSPNK